jgi:hypothetical protein
MKSYNLISFRRAKSLVAPQSSLQNIKSSTEYLGGGTLSTDRGCEPGPGLLTLPDAQLNGQRKEYSWYPAHLGSIANFAWGELSTIRWLPRAAATTPNLWLAWRTRSATLWLKQGGLDILGEVFAIYSVAFHSPPNLGVGDKIWGYGAPVALGKPSSG